MIALGIILILLSFSAHELGHAFAMYRYGVELEQISLFGFGPTLTTFKLRRWFGDTPIHIKLIPLGAYVKPAEKDYEIELTYREKIHIYGAGVIANFLFAGIIFGIGCAITGHLSLINSIYFILCILIGLFPRYTTHLVAPLGFFTIGLIIYSVTQAHPKNVAEVHKELFNNSGSLILIAQEAMKYSISLFKMIYFAALISLSVGLTNCLPFLPLDGGRITWATIRLWTKKRRLPRDIFMVVSGILFFCLIYLALGSDLVRLVKTIF